MTLVISFVIALAILVGTAVFIRFLGGKHILWSIIPANTVAFVTHKGEESGSLKKGGGAIVDILHNVPGRILDKSHSDLRQWRFKKGEEDRGFLFWFLGVQWIGFFRTLRSNTLRSFRYSREKGEEAYHLVPKDDVTPFVPFSGEQIVEVKDAETQSVFGVDLVFNIIYELLYPLKAILRVANANAVLTAMIQDRVIKVTSTQTPEKFLSGDKEHKDLLVRAVQDAEVEARRQIGTHMTSVSLLSVAVNPTDRALFELEERTKREATAAIARAEGEKKAKVLHNDADADRVERVIKPAAENDRTVAVAQAEAYRYNEKVTVVGATPMVSVSK